MAGATLAPSPEHTRRRYVDEEPRRFEPVVPALFASVDQARTAGWSPEGRDPPGPAGGGGGGAARGRDCVGNELIPEATNTSQATSDQTARSATVRAARLVWKQRQEGREALLLTILKGFQRLVESAPTGAEWRQHEDVIVSLGT